MRKKSEGIMTSIIKKSLFFFPAIILWCGCSAPKYPGFTKMADGIYYKLNFIGEGKTKPEDGVAEISFSIMTLQDSLIMKKTDSTLFVGADHEISARSENSSFLSIPLMKCLAQLNEGDSGTFIFNYSGTDVKMGMKILCIATFTEYETEQKYLAWKNDAEMNELKKLKQYLIKKNIDDSYLTDGIYFLPMKKGKGKIVEIGNTVVVHYRGSFPDSSVFDSTYEKGEPFEFKFGDDDQVIKGLELAICQMKKSEKAKIIIPSQLAFGESGSSTGIVPPFTTVEYEVEIVNLK